MGDVQLRKSLVDLVEFEVLREPSEHNLINLINKYAHVNLKDLSIEGLRMLVSQGLGLKYCVPIALRKLTTNFFAEGDYYEGDLFIAVSSIDSDFWSDFQSEKKLFITLLRKNKEEIIRRKFDRKLPDKYQSLINQ